MKQPLVRNQIYHRVYDKHEMKIASTAVEIFEKAQMNYFRDENKINVINDENSSYDRKEKRYSNSFTKQFDFFSHKEGNILWESEKSAVNGRKIVVH